MIFLFIKMPYARRFFRRSRRPAYRRKTYRRRRFSKKRFAKNNVNQLTMRAPLAARLLRVKLPWVFIEDNTIVANQSVIHSFQGSGLVPWTANGNNASNNFAGYGNAIAGDILPAGALEYSQFYDRYFVNGSSIKVEAIVTENFQGVIRAVLLAVPFTTDGGATNDNYPAVRTQLDGYTYEQLLAWPYAKWRMIGTAEGGRSKLNFKMFRKTKHMCGIKDLRDNQHYGWHLTDGSFTDPGGSGLGVNPANGFMYYLRFFNMSAEDDVDISITVRMSLYMTLTNREFNPTVKFVSPE